MNILFALKGSKLFIIIGWTLLSVCRLLVLIFSASRFVFSWSGGKVVQWVRRCYWLSIDRTPQSELPRPIKIGLGCVYGVELCTKLLHSVSRKCVRKIVLNHVEAARLKSIFLVFQNILSTRQIMFTCFIKISP